VIALVLDTHALTWVVHGDPRLSTTARQTIDAATSQTSPVAISAISLVETAYLEEKGRIPTGTLTGILALLEASNPLLVEVPVNRQIVAALLTLSRSALPDMPDRVIAATALSLAVPLVSRDGKIQDSHIQTIW
jgi:PIN domain nuclease of toxin-antitoxin system